jgi:hypothetical protein
LAWWKSHVPHSPPPLLSSVHRPAQFEEGKPPGEPDLNAARQEPRTPRIPKGDLHRPSSRVLSKVGIPLLQPVEGWTQSKQRHVLCRPVPGRTIEKESLFLRPRLRPTAAAVETQLRRGMGNEARLVENKTCEKSGGVSTWESNPGKASENRCVPFVATANQPRRLVTSARERTPILESWQTAARTPGGLEVPFSKLKIVTFARSPR